MCFSSRKSKYEQHKPNRKSKYEHNPNYIGHGNHLNNQGGVIGERRPQHLDENQLNSLGWQKPEILALWSHSLDCEEQHESTKVEINIIAV